MKFMANGSRAAEEVEGGVENFLVLKSLTGFSINGTGVVGDRNDI